MNYVDSSILRNCSSVGVLIAHPLLRQKKMTGDSMTAAKFSAAWKSPCRNISQSEKSIMVVEVLLMQQ